MAFKLGVIGGTGQLGRAIIDGLLVSKVVDPNSFWISNRSGSSGLPDGWEGAHLTTSNQELVKQADIIVISVPPAAFSSVKIDAVGKLVVSVIAGVTVERITRQTSADRVVRAMSSPAAEYGLAYSPWFASKALSDEDRKNVTVLFKGCGTTDELDDEAHLDLFTALTGPVPGFVALFAATMVEYAEQRGISNKIADRAVRQLFLASGHILAAEEKQPHQYVEEMIRYAGTTAAGLEAMRSSPLAENIMAGLDAACARARTIAGS